MGCLCSRKMLIFLCYMTPEKTEEELWYSLTHKRWKTWNNLNTLCCTGPVNSLAGGGCFASWTVLRFGSSIKKEKTTRQQAGRRQSLITAKNWLPRYDSEEVLGRTLITWLQNIDSYLISTVSFYSLSWIWWVTSSSFWQRRRGLVSSLFLWEWE